MASAAVMLGLMPSLMASFGPTLAESSVLLLERPFLGFVLAIGSPAMYPSRPLESYNPLDTLRQPPMRLPIASHGRKMSIIISLIQLVVAVIAAGNVLATSLELGAKTVVTWKKANSYLPLTWVVLALFIYMLAVIRLRLLVGPTRNLLPISAPRPPDPFRLTDPTNSDSLYSYSTSHSKESETKRNLRGSIFKFLKPETKVCTTEMKYDFLAPKAETYVIYILSTLLPIVNLVHIMFGTLVFSSLLFIGVTDVLPIILRYGGSAAAAQMIRTMEITGLRRTYMR
ncbi:hypothetical protein MMC14_000128 [Varicellaria rhodocarpa]|nr:hypothetical protein [Varicellaria rhodocarpa]